MTDISRRGGPRRRISVYSVSRRDSLAAVAAGGGWHLAEARRGALSAFEKSPAPPSVLFVSYGLGFGSRRTANVHGSNLRWRSGAGHASDGCVFRGRLHGVAGGRRGTDVGVLSGEGQARADGWTPDRRT